MSDQVPPREWRFYIRDMIGFAERVVSYKHGMDQPAFVASGLTYDAILRNLELIGEAAEISRTQSARTIHRYRGVS